MRVLPRVLEAITPSREEREIELAFCEMLVAHIRDNAPQSCMVVLTGSMAKGTFLRDKRDIDVFVLFDRSVPKEELEPSIKNIMDSAFPSLGYQLSYAEHPYVRFHFEGRRIDLVPAYRITEASERISAVDRSVLHTEFVRKSLTESQAGSVLLLKQFLRAGGIYGAEIKTAGFSGYLCELLIIHYGSFEKLLKAASKWKKGAFIDLKKHYKSPKAAKEAAKRFGIFAVIDPTDRNRNVAAAVSPASLKAFIALAKAFLKKPAEGAFFRKPESFEDKLRKSRRRTLIVSMPRPDIVDDILWGQLYKMLNQLEKHLAEFGPGRILADDSRHLVRLAIPLSRDRLPPEVLVAGPPLKMKANLEKFRKSHRRAKFVKKGGRLWAVTKRAETRPEQYVAGFFRAYAKTRSHLAYPPEMIVVERLDRKKFR
ncbi:MAG TPA: CCA tRNA nucleotidyltransferase [Candidatus Bilamarchaeum sp.]|nr:CCA tRNA nucleotidyltransferase [Candidatus Bilamarchaeum sp.]